ncbi:MAG: hypothetical protein U5O15_02765 [Candidatus Krumholzibacteriota bacterium]|nr:hypothetical protein [Candidatus Krumholzibacteriota bacterium]
MKRYIEIILLFLIAVSVSGNAAGQSIFSLNYIGQHQFRGGARSIALGLSALAVPDSNMAGTMNTATLSDLNAVTLSVTEKLHMSRVSYRMEESNQSRFLFPSVIVAAPVTEGLVLSAGYRTRFAGRADFTFPGELIGSESSSASEPSEEYELDSSLYSVPFGLSWRINEWVSIGGELQIERGSITDGVTIAFEDSDYGTSYSERKRTFSGASWSLSFLAKLHSRFYIAGVFDGGVGYSVNEYITHTRSEFNSSDSWNFDLPPAYSAGIAVGLSERWWITSAFWLRAAPDASGFSAFEGALGTEKLYSVGLERRADKEGDDWFSRMPLRAGFYENTWHIEIPGGEPVKSRFFTLGSGFEIPGGDGNLDWAFEFGRVGSLERNGIDETVFRLSVSLGISEAWEKRVIEKH